MNYHPDWADMFTDHEVTTITQAWCRYRLVSSTMAAAFDFCEIGLSTWRPGILAMLQLIERIQEIEASGEYQDFSGPINDAIIRALQEVNA